MAETTAQEANAKCVMCGLCYGNAQGRQHGRSFKCWNCLNVEQTLRRHLGTTADLAEFSQEETENFFQAAKSAKATDGKVTWQTIRATLLKVRDHCPSRRTADERPSDPWLARGSCAEAPFRTLGGAWLRAVLCSAGSHVHMGRSVSEL